MDENIRGTCNIMPYRKPRDFVGSVFKLVYQRASNLGVKLVKCFF